MRAARRAARAVDRRLDTELDWLRSRRGRADLAVFHEFAPPPSGGSKVQMLKGNDYIRVWINRGGTHYLMHLPASAGL